MYCKNAMKQAVYTINMPLVELFFYPSRFKLHFHVIFYIATNRESIKQKMDTYN